MIRERMISSDLPITKAVDDKLNRKSFADNLAQVLLQYSFPSSFTIGLYGEWGSGKTSLLNMVLETVESTDDHAVILRFNPWLCADTSQLIRQFFKQMATAIKLKKPASAHVWELIDQYADIWDTASLIPGAGVIFAAAGKTLTKKAKKHIDQRAGDLQGRKNQIIEKMAENIWKKSFRFPSKCRHPAGQTSMTRFFQSSTQSLKTFRKKDGTRQHGRSCFSLE